MSTCPCCGSELTGAPVNTVLGVELTGTQRRILEYLVRAYPHSMSRERLAGLVYADHPDGGPINAGNVISVMLHKMRPKLEAIGWTAGGVGGKQLAIRRIH